MHLTGKRTVALGGAILLTVSVAVAAVPLVAGGDGDRRGGGVEVEVASADVPPADAAPATTAGPETTVPPTNAPTPPAPAPPTTARAASRSGTPTPAAPTDGGAAPAPGPTAPAAPSSPRVAPGQRLNPTSAQVQAAMATLHQRISLFQPTEPQLRTFADAVCTSLDQGQSLAQVQSTVRDAVSRIQGASLSAADAAFAVATVIELRCPGYLP